MSRLIVDYIYYSANFKGALVRQEEFDALSRGAQLLCERYAFSRMNRVLRERFLEISPLDEDYKDAICLGIEMLEKSNGIHALTGAGDSNSENMLDGIPFSALSKNKIEMFLSDNDLLLR